MRTLVFALAAVALAGPASAHWQFTKWGMTPAQVISASQGAAASVPPEKSVQGDLMKAAVGQYTAGAYQFDVGYWFNASGLSLVDMWLSGETKCLSLQRDLIAKYGEPLERSGGRSMWADRAAENRVVFIYRHEPLRSPIRSADVGRFIMRKTGVG